MEEEGRPGIISVVVTIIAFLLQLIGMLTPGWLYMIVDYISVQAGLWYVITCIHSKCVTASTVTGIAGTGAASKLYTSSMRLYQGLTVIGTLMCLLALILLIVTRRSGAQTNKTRNTSIFCLLVSGVFSIAAAGKFGDALLTGIKLFKLYGTAHPYKFPYSLVMTGVGGVLAIILFFNLLCKTCKSRGNTDTSTTGGIVLAPSPYTNTNGKV